MCGHKVALITHIAGGRKAKAAAKVTKKVGKAEALLSDVDPNDLKEWVMGLIKKNKDIELSFIHYFSVKEPLKPDEVKSIVNDAIKAIVGNKKTIDLTQLKKLVELWAEMLAPVFEHYQANVMDEKSFLNFHTALEGCFAFQYKTNTTSNRIVKFIDDALQKSVEPVNALYDDDLWEKAVGYFVSNIPEGVNRVRLHYLFHLKSILSGCADERKVKLIDLLAKQYAKTDPDRLMNGAIYCKLIFDIVDENKLFGKYNRLFKPIVFDNDFNIRLISLLIEHRLLDLASKYCKQQIQSNYRDEFNVPYLKLLKEILLIENETAKLTQVLTTLVLFTFNDYQFVSQTLPGDERKKWRTKILTKARNAPAPYKVQGTEFCFKLLDSEKSYRKMIDDIDSYTPYGLILQYFEKMVAADKDKLLDGLCRRGDTYLWNPLFRNAKNDAEYFPELFKLVKKYYTTVFINLVIEKWTSNNRFYNPNSFVQYMQEQLLKGKETPAP